MRTLNTELSDCFKKISLDETDDNIAKFFKLRNGLAAIGVNPKEIDNILFSFLNNKTTKTIIESSLINAPLFNIPGKLEDLKKAFPNVNDLGKKYAKAIEKAPKLITANIDELQTKVITFTNFLTNTGMNVSKAFDIFVKEPSLFLSNPNTLQNKFHDILKELSPLGLTRKALTLGISKQPQLLSVTPDEIVKRTKLLLNFHHDRLWEIVNPQESDKQVISFLFMQKPLVLNYADENLKMRRVYSLLKQEVDRREDRKPMPLKPGTFFRTKAEAFQRMAELARVLNDRKILDRMIKEGLLEQAICAKLLGKTA